MFIKSNYPKITYESSVGRSIQFNVPSSMLHNLKEIIENLTCNAERCGIKKVTIRNVDFNSYFQTLYNKYNNASLLELESKLQVSHETIYDRRLLSTNKSFIERYVCHFSVLFRYYTILLYRFPNQCIISVIGPSSALFIFTILILFTKPTQIFLNLSPIYEDLSIIAGYSNNTNSFNSTIQEIVEKFSSYYIFRNVDFNVFISIIKSNVRDIYSNTNQTSLIALYFDIDSSNSLSINIHSNFESYLAKTYNVLQNYFSNPLFYISGENNIKVSKYYKSNEHVSHINDNFLLKLVYITIVVFICNVMRNEIRIQNNGDRIIQRFRAHHSLYIIPKYLHNLIVLFTFYGFMILFIYVVNDFKLSLINGDVSILLIILFLYGMTDAIFKSLIVRALKCSPSIIFGLIVLDISAFSIFSFNSFLEYKIILKQFGFTAGFQCSSKVNFLQLLLIFLIPSVNLSNGFSMFLEKETNKCIQGKCNSLFQRYLTIGNNSFNICIICVIFLCQFVVYSFLFLLLNKYKYNHKSIWETSLKYYRMIMDFNFTNTKKHLNITNKDVTVWFYNVSYSTEGVVIFSNLNWKVYRNTISLVLGPNTSIGKEVLSELIIGYKTPDSGNICYRSSGFQIIRTKRKKLDISYCQNISFLQEELTVYELLLFWINVRCVSNKIIKSLIKTTIQGFSLENDINRMTKNLSLMTKKKIIIAVSIIGFPELIILDDPLSSLDIPSQQQVINMLSLAKSNGSTIIVNAMEINNLYRIADDVLILKNDIIQYQGSWNDIPEDAFVGYYLILILNNDEELPVFNIEEIMALKFPQIKMIIKHKDKIIFFMPTEDKINIDFNYFIQEMEELLTEIKSIAQYLISFNFMSLECNKYSYK